MIDNFLSREHLQQIIQGIETNFLISKTNPKGIITYVNNLFCEVSEYTKEELIGKPHNIVRHPDMPKSVFKELWETIKDKKQAWTGVIKNKTKSGSYYWVTTNIFPIFDSQNPQEIVEYVSVRKEITTQMDGFEKDQLFSQLYEILNFYHTSEDLKQTLEFALDKILKFSWLEVQRKGGIMLWNEQTKQLEMFVHRGVGASLLNLCNRVPLGRCLCGRAAERKALVFKDCVDEEHENRPEGIQPHGHYNVPLMFQDKPMGVMFLYVEHGYKKRKIEEEFLNLLGQVLGSIIYKYKLENELQQEIVKNQLIIDYIKTYSSKTTFKVARDLFNTNNLFFDNLFEAQNLVGNKYLFLMFLDVVGFTKFSENKEPREVLQVLNNLFSPIIEIIYKNDGDLDKFIGDAIFSYFENPIDCYNAGLEILKAINDPQNNPHQIAVRIGMHCGYVAQANLGNYVRRDFTLIGDTVNTTQRLESAAKPNSILMSEDFRKQLNLSNTNGTEFTFSKKMFLKAKNKAEMIPVFLVSRN